MQQLIEELGVQKLKNAAVPNQLLAANAKAIIYQMEEYKKSSLVVILYCLSSFQHKNYVTFQYYMYCLGKTTR